MSFGLWKVVLSACSAVKTKTRIKYFFMIWRAQPSSSNQEVERARKT